MSRSDLISSIRAAYHPDKHVLSIKWSSALAKLQPETVKRSVRRTSVGELGDWAITWPDQDVSGHASHKGFHKGLVEELKASGGGGKSGEGSGGTGPTSGGSGMVEMVQKSKGEDFAGLFTSRPFVQAPERIFPASSEDDDNLTFTVYYLLAPDYRPPKEIELSYTPLSWSPAPPTPAGKFAVEEATSADTDSATEWAKLRLEDLRTLSALAQELTTSGSRNRATGLLKRGVDGSGMDVAEILQEARMVEEEMRWIEDVFLGAAASFYGYGVGPTEEETEEDEKEAIEKALAEMQRLATELRLERASSPIVGPGEGPSFAAPQSDFGERLRQAPLYQQASINAALGLPPQRPSVQTNYTAPSPVPIEEDPEASPLFAVPLSPRSPDMPISPFSLLKGIPDSIFAKTHPKGPTQTEKKTPASIFIPKGPVQELPGIVVRSPREPTTPTLASMPSPEHLRKKMNWGAR
jgi:hypothetical protein